MVEAASRPPELVRDVCSQHERVIVSVGGRPSVVLLTVEDLLALGESLAVLSDVGTMRFSPPAAVDSLPSSQDSVSRSWTNVTAWTT
jgi:hypothetical protein